MQNALATDLGTQLESAAQTTHSSGSDRDTVVVLPTELDAAEYMVSYRILECGAIYHPIELDRKARETRARLHVRVQKTGTGQILFADNLSHAITDMLSTDAPQELANYHCAFTPTDLPLVRGSDDRLREYGMKDKPRGKEREYTTLSGIAGVIGTLALIGSLQ